MKVFITRILPFLFFCFFIGSCSTGEKKSSSKLLEPSSAEKEEFQKALKYMENEHYKLAAEKFLDLSQRKAQKNPEHEYESFFYSSARFNAGLSYFQIKECLKAKNIFTDLISKSDKNYKFKAQAFLYLHYSYDCLHEPHQALSALKNAEGRKKSLNEETQEVEIPARFSILYAQLKNKKQALMFQNRALNGLKKIKSPVKDPVILKQKASKLFYLMGRNYIKTSHISMDQYLLALPYHQVYLAQAFLLSDPVWSVESQKELENIYEKLWKAFQKIPREKKGVYKTKIIRILNNFQKMAQESQSKELEEILSDIVQKARSAMKK